jgi:hypothetical protein
MFMIRPRALRSPARAGPPDSFESCEAFVDLHASMASRLNLRIGLSALDLFVDEPENFGKSDQCS